MYGDSIIRLKIGQVKIKVKEREIIISFNILLLGKDEVVLGMPFLREFNPKINWITG